MNKGKTVDDKLHKLKKCVCVWDDEEGWPSTCGECFYFEDGGPKENGFKFCPYCGKPLEGKV